MARAIRPVGAQGQVNLASRYFHSSRHQRDIAFMYLVLTEQTGNQPMHTLSPRKHQQARGAHIQPVYAARIGKFTLHPGRHTVRFIHAAPRHRQQPGRLVHYQERGVAIN